LILVIGIAHSDACVLNPVDPPVHSK